MKKTKALAVVFSAVLAIGLVGCGGGSSTESDDASQPEQQEQQEQQEPAPAPEPLDLKGSWVMRAEDGSDTQFQALIEDDYITVQLYGDGSSMIYWAGSYEAPTDAAKEFSWVSQNDKDVTKMSLLGSRDDTKEFRYKDGVLSCDITIQGKDGEIKMEKVEGEEAAEIAKSLEPEFAVTIGEAVRTSSDYEDKDVLVVSYTWTNNSDEACSFDLSVSTKAFQDSIELKTGLFSGDEFDTMADSLDIQPGATQEVWQVYVLTSDSDVKVEASELWGGRSFGEKTFSVK